MSNQIKVTKRSGKKEPLMLDKILDRINQQTYNLDSNWIIPFEVAQKVIEGIYDGISSRELDKLAMETAASLTTKHPDYSILAGRLAVSSLHKETKKSFSETVKDMYNYKDPTTKDHKPIVSETFKNLVMDNADSLDSAIVHSRDYNFDFFGFKTLEKSYLLKMNGQPVERPQFLYMRSALEIHGDDLEKAIETYNYMSEGYFTHATPTLFNSGTNRPQLASCFLLDMKGDSIEGIFDTLKDSALISKNAGGIGIAISKIRASGTYIAGTNGTSNGLIPFLKIFNETARAVDQGGGKRKGSIAMYIEPWHADILPFLDLRKNHGKEELRARDLFLALWVNDLFMERVDLDQDWSLMCPHESPGLQEAYGDEFRELYEKYEEEGRYKTKVKAREIWNKVLESQIETGTPYILYKDSINEKSNQKNLGTIKSSNLCAEIVEYTSPDEIAVCNLASIALPMFVNKNKTYNFNKLHDVAYHVTVNLNNVIDKTYYPIEEARNSNLRHRPIGLGVQGLADVFFKTGISYDSEEARKLNKEIFETIYHAAIEASCDLAKENGTYETYEGSPISKGIFQFDAWGVTPTERWNWDKLRQKVLKHGVRNSLTTCIMPTASTANILGNEASCEAQTSNMYVRRVLSGEFPIVNKHLVKDLIKLKLWSEDLKNKIVVNNGSIQDINEIPQEIKDVYKTVWEIKQKSVINLAADRGAFIDQTQSMNIFMANPNFAKLTSMHFYAWGRRSFMKDEEGNPILPKENDNIEIIKDEEGNPKFYREKKGNLKTGMYYLRTKAATGAVKFTAKSVTQEEVDQNMADISCSLDDPDSCLACGS